ncbi:MAG: Fe(2+)-trafficking protein [Planctomycetes bacterium]|nr:Fe(2+)-trafficking protein [Planctomycetota bacterium]
MTDDSRIKQFEQMASADPDNELGHFSLGRAYLGAERFDDAAVSFARVVELNPKMSKAYQLLGEALDGAGKRTDAIDALTKGIGVANELGDRMPLEAMADKLRSWDAPVPTYETPTAEAEAPAASGPSAAGFRCCRCGRPDGQLEKRPFKGDMGEKILANVCNGCWREWIGQGTKVINELGLALSSKEGQDAYDQYMLEFLQLEEV